MKKNILEKLSIINEDEERILDIETKVNKRLYNTYAKEFFLNNHRRMQTGGPIVLRRHTRFTDFPLHGHNYVEMTYLCSGEMTHVVKHREVKMKAGDLLLMNRHTGHVIRKTGEGDIAISIMLSPDCFHSFASLLPPGSPLSSFIAEDMRQNGGSEYILFNTDGIPPLENLFENIAHALVGTDGASQDILKASVGLILRYLTEIPECMATIAKKRSDAELLQARIEEYLNNEYRTASLSELATKLGLSAPYLSKRVRELCGLTFSELLQEARFCEALRLLSETDLPIGDIIVAVGYENTSFFHNQFKNRYHCSPFQWRKERKK